MYTYIYGFITLQVKTFLYLLIGVPRTMGILIHNLNNERKRRTKSHDI